MMPDRLTSWKETFSVVGRMASVLMLLAACVALGSAPPTDSKDDEDELIRKPKVSEPGVGGGLWGRLWDIGPRAGFEIGNGRKLIKNLPGQYLLKIYDKWEVGQLDAFTEVISPLAEGVPRARLTINVVSDPNIQSVEDLIESRQDMGNWIPVVLGRLSGVQQDSRLSSGLHDVEVRLFRNPGEVMVLRLDGKPGERELTVFDKIQNALTTFQASLQ